MLGAIWLQPLGLPGEVFRPGPLGHEHCPAAVDLGKFRQVGLHLSAIFRPVDHELHLVVVMVYQTADRPGALMETLKIFSQRKINLVKLESRPVAGRPWEYMFYVDLEADVEAPEFEPVLEELKQHTDYLKILGAY